MDGAAAIVQQASAREDKTTGAYRAQIYLLSVENLEPLKAARIVEVLRSIGCND